MKEERPRKSEEKMAERKGQTEGQQKKKKKKREGKKIGFQVGDIGTTEAKKKAKQTNYIGKIQIDTQAARDGDTRL